MTKWRKTIGLLTTLALVLALVVGACDPAPTAEEEKMVEIGWIGPLTGPGATLTQLGLYGFEDYLKYFNEEIGISGVTIKLLWADDQRQLAPAISAYQRFVERRVPVFSFNNPETMAPIIRGMERDMVPAVVALQNKQMFYPPGWVYGMSPTYAEAFASLADYIVQNWKEERPPRLAFVIFDGAYGWAPVKEGSKYAESLGIEMLPVEIAPFVVLDATTQLSRLSERGADFVFIQGITPMSMPILSDAERLGLLEKMHFSGAESSAGEILIEGAGAASEGYLIPKVAPWWDETEVPGVKLMIDNQIKYYGKERSRRENAYVITWEAAAIICEAVRRAIEEVGYESLNGSAIRRALDSIKDFDVYGLAKISYTPEDHRGSNRAAVYQIEGGKIVRVSDWREAPMLVPEG